MVTTPSQEQLLVLLTKLGVFDTKSGSVAMVLHFDGTGVIRSVEATTTQHYKL